MPSSSPLSTGAWSVLALLCEGDTHGWALVRALAPTGEIGRVWSTKRALVYRTVDLIVEAGFVERAGVEEGTRGATRTLLRATPAGHAAVAGWLAEPVRHVRDLRSDLLLKLLFNQRAGHNRVPLLHTQRALIAEIVGQLEARVSAASTTDATVDAFRLETARAGLRFVEGELARTISTA